MATLLTPQPERILRTKDLSRLFGIAPLTVYRWRDAGKLPPQIKIGTRMIGWRESEIMAMLDAAQRAGINAAKTKEIVALAAAGALG